MKKNPISLILLFFILLSSEVFSCEKISRVPNLLCNGLSRNHLRMYNTATALNKNEIYEAKTLNEIYAHVGCIVKSFEEIDYSRNAHKDVPLSIRTMFRGQKEAGWKLVPGILRHGNFDETSALRHLKMVHHSIFDKEKITINDLSRAQHYGLYTRLLDFSGNLLSSIFFAVEESQKKDSDTKEHALYVLDGATLNEFAFMNPDDKGMFTPTSFETLLRLRAAESKTFDQILLFDDIIESARINKINLSHSEQRRKIAEKLRYPIAIYPNMDNPRIMAQDGRFVIWGGKAWPNFYETGSDRFHIKPFNLEDEAMQYREDVTTEKTEKRKVNFVYKIKIKNGYQIKQELEIIYGINRAKLYQSVDDTTKWLNELWKKS